MSIPRFTFTERAAPFLELGTGDSRTDIGVAVWDTAHWDNAADATWSGAEPLWGDETCHGYAIELQAGRQRNTDNFAPATATVTMDNSDGWADALILRLRPGRPLRIGIEHSTLGRIILFRGIVDAVAPTYTPDQGDAVEISAICALGEVGRVKLAKTAVAFGAADEAHSRVARILTAAKWPASKRDLQPSSVTCSAAVFGQQVADMFNIVAESTGGAVYGDTAGRVVFRGQDWQMFESGSPPDGTIGNVSAGDVCPSEWQLGHRRDDLITQIILGRQGVDDVPFTYDDTVGQSLYGVEVFQATDLICETTVQLTRLKNRLFRVRGGAGSAERIERVLIDAATSDAALDLAAMATVYEQPSRYRCRHVASRGVVFDVEMLVTGIRHSITPDAWTCDLDLDAAAPFATVGGRWDTARWDQNNWAGPTRMAA